MRQIGTVFALAFLLTSGPAEACELVHEFRTGDDDLARLVQRMDDLICLTQEQTEKIADLQRTVDDLRMEVGQTGFDVADIEEIARAIKKQGD